MTHFGRGAILVEGGIADAVLEAGNLLLQCLLLHHRHVRTVPDGMEVVVLLSYDLLSQLQLGHLPAEDMMAEFTMTVLHLTLQSNDYSIVRCRIHS